MADLAATDVTYTRDFNTESVSSGRHTGVYKAVFGDSALTYPSGGVPLTTASLGAPTFVESFSIIDADDSNGYIYKIDRPNNKLRIYQGGAGNLAGAGGTGLTGTVDDNDNAATLGHALYVIPYGVPGVQAVNLTAEASATGLLNDNDSAASNGVLIYVVVDDPNWSGTYQLGHLEFVSPTNANGTCTIASGADTLTLFDDDAAATNGVVVRAVAASGGLEATTAASKDILVQLSTGKYLHINHATTASTPSIYFDEDAGNTYERLQAVVVDNGDEPYSVFVEDATTEYAGTALSQGTSDLASIVTVGPAPFTYAVGSGGPTILVASRPDAASLPGAVALNVVAAAAGFDAANFGKQDLFVPLSNGHHIKVAYAASPAGVQVYGLPEAASTDLSFVAVVVDNADETFSSVNSQSGVELGNIPVASTTIYIKSTGW